MGRANTAVEYDAVLDALVRRVDEDRWLASRFAPAPFRARLVAIYALNHEIARAVRVTSEPAIGAIRLAWWRDALAEVHAGAPPRGHPALRAYARLAMPTWARRWDKLIDARAAELDAAPFADWEALAAQAEACEGAVMRLAASACGEDADEAVVKLLARAWGGLGAPPSWREQALAAYQQAKAQWAAVPAASFPALGYVALAPLYARGRAPSLFARQLKLVWASATGRF